MGANTSQPGMPSVASYTSALLGFHYHPAAHTPRPHPTWPIRLCWPKQLLLMIPGSASIVSSTSHSLKFSPHAVCQNSPGNYPASWSSWGQDPAAGPGHQATHRDYGEAAQVHNMRLQVTQAKRPQKVGSTNQILRLHILNSKWPPCYRKGSSSTYTEPECWLSQGN